MKRINHSVRFILLSFAAVLLLSGCGSSNKLADYDYSGRTVAAVYEFPPYPEVLTGAYFPGHPKRPIHAVIRLGSRIAKEIEANDLREKLAEASDSVDVASLLSDRLLTRSARYLGADPVGDERDADFLLEVRVRDYGIDAEDWDAAAHFFVDAEVVLLERRTGHEIWRNRVKERDNITPAVFGPIPVRNVVTAHAFSQLSVEEIGAALEGLSEYAADSIADHLRDGLRKARK
ncbi:MAG: hypothetical protein R2832_15205 [Rhodothermales bacterium]